MGRTSSLGPERACRSDVPWRGHTGDSAAKPPFPGLWVMSGATRCRCPRSSRCPGRSRRSLAARYVVTEQLGVSLAGHLSASCRVFHPSDTRSRAEIRTGQSDAPTRAQTSWPAGSVSRAAGGFCIEALATPREHSPGHSTLSPDPALSRDPAAARFLPAPTRVPVPQPGLPPGSAAVPALVGRSMLPRRNAGCPGDTCRWVLPATGGPGRACRCCRGGAGCSQGRRGQRT